MKRKPRRETQEELETVDCREMGQSGQAGPEDYPRGPTLVRGPQRNKRDVSGVGATPCAVAKGDAGHTEDRRKEGDAETKGRKVADVSARLGTGLHGETLG